MVATVSPCLASRTALSPTDTEINSLTTQPQRRLHNGLEAADDMAAFLRELDPSGQMDACPSLNRVVKFMTKVPEVLL